MTAELGLDQGPHDREPQAGRAVQLEALRQAAAVVVDADLEPAHRAVARSARSRPVGAPSGDSRAPRRSGAARSAPSRAASPAPRRASRTVPSRRTRDPHRPARRRSPSAPAGRRSRRSRRLLDRLAQRLVDDRDRADPAYGLLQGGGRLPESIRRACSRSSAATVCRLFFTRWWISRMVVSLVTSSRSRRRRSVTSRSRITPPMCSPSGRSGIARTISATVAGADLGVAVRRAAEDRAQRLLVGPPPRRHQVAGEIGEQVAGEVTGQAEPAVDRQRVGARVDHATGGVDAEEPVADPRGVGVVAALARRPGSGRTRSSWSGRRRSAGS